MSDLEQAIETKRIAQILTKDGWTAIEFMELKKGDTFRLFEYDGTQVADKYGNTAWDASSDAYINEDGTGIIDTDDGEDDEV